MPHLKSTSTDLSLLSFRASKMLNKVWGEAPWRQQMHMSKPKRINKSLLKSETHWLVIVKNTNDTESTLLPKYAKQSKTKAIKLVRQRVKVAFGCASFMWALSRFSSFVREAHKVEKRERQQKKKQQGNLVYIKQRSNDACSISCKCRKSKSHYASINKWRDLNNRKPKEGRRGKATSKSRRRI